MKNRCWICLIFSMSCSTFAYGQNPTCKFDTSRFAELTFAEIPYKVFDSIALVNESRLTETEKCIIQKTIVEMFNSRMYPGFPYHYADYKMQLVPGIDSGGRKFVWVYGLCKHSSQYNFDGWRKYVARTADGGVCYFQGLVDLAGKRIIEFSFNGEARNRKMNNELKDERSVVVEAK